jgi:hypothetical protein
LVWFALLTFVILAMAALTTDLGFARLTQRQMQMAADTAALEGVRLRDQVPEFWLQDAAFLTAVQADCGAPPTTPQTATDPDWQSWRDKVRRWAASTRAAQVFDDDFNPGNGDPHNFGAGPVIDLAGGVGPSNAWQTIAPGSPPVYKPTRHNGVPGLELNLPNAQHGDIVAGRFLQFPATAGAAEDRDYNRLLNDFQPVDASLAASADALLVRLRRSNDFAGHDAIAGESSRGPALPFLFGRGSLMAGGDPTAGYSPRHHGITVRGTAIAAARPAFSVGLPVASVSPPLPGLTPFVLRRAFWNTLTPGSAVPGQIVGVSIQVSGQEQGWFIVPQLSRLGDVLVRAGAVPGAYSDPGWVPLVEEVNGQERVIGFGYAQLVPGAGAAVAIRMLPGIVAPVNASASLIQPVSALTAQEFSTILTLNAGLKESLKAAALVR